MDQERIKEARQKALAILLYRDRTEFELKEKLAKYGFEEEYIDDAIEYVRSFHYIDDERYARNFIEVAKRTKSMRRIEQDLKKRGIEGELLDLMMEEYEGDEEALNYCLAKKLQGKLIEELEFKEKNKVMAFLMRKGFVSSDVYRLFR